MVVCVLFGLVCVLLFLSGWIGCVCCYVGVVIVVEWYGESLFEVICWL